MNKDGKTVAPSRESSRPRRRTPTGTRPPGYYVILTDQPGAGSWPITGATFILMHKQPQDPAAATEALKFFDWAYTKGDKMAEELDYVPLPDEVVGMVKKTWATDIKDAAASRSTRSRNERLARKGGGLPSTIACLVVGFRLRGCPHALWAGSPGALSMSRPRRPHDRPGA